MKHFFLKCLKLQKRLMLVIKLKLIKIQNYKCEQKLEKQNIIKVVYTIINLQK